MNIKVASIFLLILISLFFKPVQAQKGVESDSLQLLSFFKDENISGIVFTGRPEREGLRTDFSAENEELFTGAAKYRFGKRHWEMTRYQQEIVNLFIETGLVGGTGNWRDSTNIREIEADRSLFGWRTNLTANYSNRYYFDVKNYTLVEVNAWGLYDVYRQNSEGTVVDSNGVSSAYENTETDDKLRFGFEAKAAWGVGRLNPVNHYMVAEYLLDEYYNRRVFSDDETLQLAIKIAEIKHRRDKNSDVTETELQELTEFFKSKLMLKAPDSFVTDWLLGEFLPRYNGNRLEFGPFFNYFNREPDFIYGAFVKFENAKYIDYRKNRNFSVALNYNRYKMEDWFLLETDLGWSFYSGLRSRFTTGVKYAPGITVQNIEDFGPLIHNFTPYVEYFTQLNSKMRMDVALAWTIADDDKFLQSGPRFLLSFYRSKY